jgi:hypothetical protein
MRCFIVEPFKDAKNSSKGAFVLGSYGEFGLTPFCIIRPRVVKDNNGCAYTREDS